MDANFQAISTLLQTGDIYHIQNFETTTLWTCKLNEVFIQGDVKIALQELSTEDPAISPSLFFNFFDYYGFFWLNFFFSNSTFFRYALCFRNLARRISKYGYYN